MDGASRHNPRSGWMPRAIALVLWLVPTAAVFLATQAHRLVERELVRGTTTSDLRRPLVSVFRRSYIDALAQASKQHPLDLDGSVSWTAAAIVAVCAVLSMGAGWAATRGGRTSWPGLLGLGVSALAACALVFRQSTTAPTQFLCAARGALVVAAFSCLVFMVPAAIRAGRAPGPAGVQRSWDVGRAASIRLPKRLLLWAAPIALLLAFVVYLIVLFFDANGFRADRLALLLRYYLVTLPTARLLNVATYDLTASYEPPVVLPVGCDIHYSTPSASYTVVVKPGAAAQELAARGADVADWKLLESRSASELVSPSGSGPVVGTPDGFLQFRNPIEGPAGRRAYLRTGERLIGLMGGQGAIECELRSRP
jgi:hypothetical protein